MITIPYLKIPAAVFLILMLSGCSISRVIRVADRTAINVTGMIDEVSSSPVILIGERHDSSAHHTLQLQVIQGLALRGKKLAIGMEMFEYPSQRALDAWSAGSISNREFIQLYQKEWRNLPYRLYEDIFNYARDHAIPIIALNAPRDIVVKVSRQGFASLNDVDRGRLPDGIDAEVSNTYLDFIRSSYAVHGGREEQFRFICEAQMLRNRVMARRITDYYRQHPEITMIIIAGGGHVRERGGIPSELGTLPFTTILPPIGGVTAKSVRREDAGYLIDESFSLFDLL